MFAEVEVYRTVGMKPRLWSFLYHLYRTSINHLSPHHLLFYLSSSEWNGKFVVKGI